MKPEIKKLLILNLPYLLFVWLFDKVGAAVRLSPGADASAKLLHLGDGFTAAFSSIAPSFHPADLALGIAGAVIVRLIIYTKGKNAKKYRRGTEYGSARWGGADDIKPYTDPVFENNIPLYGGESMNIRPSAAIRQNYNEIAELCRKTAEPVYLTKNGEGDLVVMDIESFNRREKMLKLREELLAVEEDRLAGRTGCTVDELDAYLDSVIAGA